MGVTTRELIEAVREPRRYGADVPILDNEGNFSLSERRTSVPAADYDTLRAACKAVLDDLIACRYENGAGWRMSEGQYCGRGCDDRRKRQ